MSALRLILFVGAVALLLLGCASTDNKAATGDKHPGGMRIPDKLFVGDLAPDFALKTLEGARPVRLTDFRGKRPVVLVFGSYT